MRAILHLPNEVVLSHDPTDATAAPALEMKFAVPDAPPLGHVVAWQAGPGGTTVELDLDPLAVAQLAGLLDG